MNPIFALILIVLLLILVNETRKEFRRIKNKIKRFFSSSDKTYVPPHKRTVTVKGHYRTKQKRKRK